MVRVGPHRRLEIKSVDDRISVRRQRLTCGRLRTHLSEPASAHRAITQGQLSTACTAHAHLLQNLGALRLPLSITPIYPSLFAVSDRPSKGIGDGTKDDLFLVLLQKGREGDERDVAVGILS